MRWGRVGATAGIVMAVLAGCGSPGQVGSAMIVGDTGVPLAGVQTTIDGALSRRADLAAQAGQEVSDPAIARFVVSRQVTHEMLSEAAARRGITVSDEAVDAALANTDDQSLQLDRLLFDGADLRQRAWDNEIAVALAEREVDHLQVTVDATAATSEQEADQKAAALVAGGPAADAVLADPRTAAAAQTYRAATDPDAAGSIEFGLPAGRVVKYQPSPGQGYWLVVRVTDRRLDAPAEGPSVAATIDRSTLAGIGQRIAQAEVGTLEVNPRFGSWDAVRMAVVPEGQEAGTVLTVS